MYAMPTPQVIMPTNTISPLLVGVTYPCKGHQGDDVYKGQ